MNLHPTRLALLFVLVAATGLVAQTVKESVVSAPPAAVVKLGTGFDYSTGKYGFTQATEVWSVPVNASYDEGRWAFKATLPFITIKGPANIVVGSGGAEGVPPRRTTNSESGLGDITLSGTYHARPVPGALNIDLTERVKFGTASVSKGLGTGQTDFYTQVDLYQNLGKATPFATIGYRVLGTTATFALKDGAYATVGAAYRASDKIVIGAGYDWRSRIVTEAKNGTDALAFVSATPNARWNVLGYLLAGFNSASPDVGIGGQATYKF